MQWILAYGSSKLRVRNLASTMTANRHRPFQPCNNVIRRLKIIDEGGCQANWVSATAGSGSDKWCNERETDNIYLTESNRPAAPSLPFATNISSISGRHISVSTDCLAVAISSFEMEWDSEQDSIQSIVLPSL